MKNKLTPYIENDKQNNPDKSKGITINVKKEGVKENKIENDYDVEIAAGWLLAMLEKKERYSERIPLKNDRSFDVPEGITELPSNISQLVRTARQMEYSQKGLYDLTKKISQKYQELQFSFKLGNDNNNRWIEYSVQKQNLNIGDEVLWENSGLMQWEEPKKIRSIQEDPKSKRKFAFVEGVTTGIPIDELILNQKIN
jgi:hypothetical protein